MASNYPAAERDTPHTFKFIQPDGVIKLCTETPQQSGWTVDLYQEPLEV